jgi:2'-5' RNA ligase
MRLFIAINFTGEMKNQLCGAIRHLKEYAVQGNFTRCENLHLTLVFIGETAKVNEVKRAIDTVQAYPFTLNIGGLGKFRRDGGDIYWKGAEKTQELILVYQQLFDALTKVGFHLENREYKPHLTLGREVILKEDFDKDAFEKDIPNMSMQVQKISLMKSERINGKLTYTEIYAKDLQE